MSKYANILLASMAVAVLLLGGTFQQSAADPFYRSFQGSRHSFLGSVYDSFSSFSHAKGILIAAADEESEDSTGDKKDGEDGKLKELWDSVQLG